MVSMPTMMEKLVCIWDLVAIIGYMIMTIIIYLSSVLPFLSDLASHGKTREQQQLQPTSAAIPKHKSSSSSSTSVSSLIHWFNNNEMFLVKKKHFRQFYIVGIVCLTTTLYTYVQMNHLQLQLQVRTSITAAGTTNYQSISIQPPSPNEKIYSISTILLYLHLFRRLYECTYIHKWKETSMMHIAGYMVGAIHYIWLPLMFIRLPCETCFGDNSDVEPKYRSISDTSYAVQSAETTYGWRIVAVLLCLYGQYQQYRHHVLLANLRKPDRYQKSIDSSKHNRQQYSLPTDGWFQYVTCPHYFAEIIIYLSFAMLLELEKPIIYHGNRHFMVLLWVASNLTMSARINFRWYQNNLPPTVMVGKKAIIPFVL
jgi:3-oxo-5-alpha-steroid 4-dehydrogenase 3 / polyprenol reductase